MKTIAIATMDFLEAWAEQWQHYVSRFYLGAYMERMGMGRELSQESDLLNSYLPD
jgi:maltose alpha-D-glucosyltransferase/alpha-amylase